MLCRKGVAMGFFGFKRCGGGCQKIKFTEVVGLIIAIIGAIIVVQVLPLRIWLFILGFLFIILGCTLFKLF